ncbi:MAG: N-acetyltransferase family protein [Caulobacteraceae bacterium]
MAYCVRDAEVKDIPRITEVYNQGIEDRVATLETGPKTEASMKEWLVNRNEKHKVLVIEGENSCLIGWASLNPFNSRCCYSGVVDFSIYIERSSRGKGIGKILLSKLIETAKEQGFHINFTLYRALSGNHTSNQAL